MEGYNNKTHNINLTSKDKTIKDNGIQNDMLKHKNIIDLIQELGFSSEMEEFHFLFLKRQKRKKSLLQFLFFIALVSLLVLMI